MNIAMSAKPLMEDPRWISLVARDPKGRFFYGVATTGVYCRPTCGARRPRPENVTYYDGPAAAERAGFRPCKRCKPDQAPDEARRAALVTKACRIIEQAEDAPSLAALAVHVGMSPHHFHRLFKQVTGLTPKDYAVALREGKVRTGLTAGDSVTDAIYGAGYNASSRFYEKSSAVLGMAPRRYKAGGAEATISYAFGKSSLGKVLVARSDKGICAILFGEAEKDMVAELQGRFRKAMLAEAGMDFARTVKDVVALVDAPRQGHQLPLDVRGTAFQKRVWKALCRIPAGETATYAEIANRIGAPKAVRAVGSACGANHLGVAIPCHRAVRSDGSLAGYYWGLERKRALLKKESG